MPSASTGAIYIVIEFTKFRLILERCNWHTRTSGTIRVRRSSFSIIKKVEGYHSHKISEVLYLSGHAGAHAGNPGWRLQQAQATLRRGNQYTYPYSHAHPYPHAHQNADEHHPDQFLYAYQYTQNYKNTHAQQHADPYSHAHPYPHTHQNADKHRPEPYSHTNPYAHADENPNDHENDHAYEYANDHEKSHAQLYADPYAHADENTNDHENTHTDEYTDNYENANAQQYADPYAHADENTHRDTLANLSAAPWLARPAGRPGAHWRGGPGVPGRLRTQVGRPIVAGYDLLRVGNCRGR